MSNNNIIELEIWKDIPGYEGYYEASTLGRIRESSNLNIIEHEGNCKDRPRVRLPKDGKLNNTAVQKIITLTFIGEKPKKYEICHYDGDSTNNKLSNLRYDTRNENRVDIYRYGNKTGGGLFSILEVLFIRELYLTTTHNVTSLSKIFNTGTGNISAIVNRKTFKWLNDDGSIEESKTAIYAPSKYTA